MPKIFRRLQDSTVAIQGADGSPFAQDQISFVDDVGSLIRVDRNGEEIDSYDWDNIFQEDGSPAGANKASTLIYCDAQLVPVQVAARFSNTDNTLNLNTGGPDFADQFVPVCGLQTKDSELFTKVNDDVFQTEFFGEIVIAVNIHLQSSGTRNAMQIRLIRNPLVLPVVEGPIASTGYIRNTGGHNESSLHLTHVTGVGVGNQFAVGIRRESSNASACNMRFVGSSSIEMFRVR